MLHLIASSDDYLVEERLGDAVARLSRELGSEPEFLADDVTPEQVAVEIQSPSLFSPNRVLVVPEVRGWLDTTRPPAAPEHTAEADPAALVAVLRAGLPDGVGLVMGAWCGRKPKGPLVDAVVDGGELVWIALPPPPKPWEGELTLSTQQRSELRRILRTAVGGVRLEPAAERLLMDRLGFAPRQLVQETRKLAAAAGDAATVDEELVRRLVFPAEGSLEKVQDAVLTRRVVPLLELLEAVHTGGRVTDWRGKTLDERGLPIVLFAQVSSVLQRMLYLRALAEELGLGVELDAGRVDEARWYQRRFRGRIGPRLLEAVSSRTPNPVHSGRGRPPSEWALGNVFAGAARYSRRELVRAVGGMGAVEAELRGSAPDAAVSAWLARTVAGHAAAG